VDKAPVDVPLMFQVGDYRLVEDAELQLWALELPYQGGALSMVVLLPRAPDGLRDMVQKLDADRLHQVFEDLEGAEPEEVQVYLPRFRVEASFELTSTLQRLGARRAFDGRADLSGMTAAPEGLAISAVLHKAFVDVNEEGTVAGAATGATVTTLSLPPVFCADHPFLFVLRDARSGAVLFFGCLVDPAA
jgi:serpin B